MSMEVTYGRRVYEGWHRVTDQFTAKSERMVLASHIVRLPMYRVPNSEHEARATDYAFQLQVIKG